MFMFKQTHRLEMAIEKLRYEHLVQQYNAAIENNRALMSANSRNARTIQSQQDTIAKLSSEVRLLTGGLRVRQEKQKTSESTDPYLIPDVSVSDESGRRMSQDAVDEALAQYERALAAIAHEVDTSNVTEEALAAATPASKEDWEEEHRGPNEGETS